MGKRKPPLGQECFEWEDLKYEPLTPEVPNGKPTWPMPINADRAEFTEKLIVHGLIFHHRGLAGSEQGKNSDLTGLLQASLLRLTWWDLWFHPAPNFKATVAGHPATKNSSPTKLMYEACNKNHDMPRQLRILSR